MLFFFFTVRSFFSALGMGLRDSSHGRKKIYLSPRTGFVGTVVSEELSANFKLSLLNMKRVIG